MKKIRNILKGFYGVLKDADTHLKFVFFSDLNQLKDISMNEQYAGICGISETEIDLL
jgi:hypothetical protein